MGLFLTQKRKLRFGFEILKVSGLIFIYLFILSFLVFWPWVLRARSGVETRESKSTFEFAHERFNFSISNLF